MGVYSFLQRLIDSESQRFQYKAVENEETLEIHGRNLERQNSGSVSGKLQGLQQMGIRPDEAAVTTAVEPLQRQACDVWMSFSKESLEKCILSGMKI